MNDRSIIKEKIKDRLEGSKNYDEMMDRIIDFIEENYIIPMEVKSDD